MQLNPTLAEAPATAAPRWSMPSVVVAVTAWLRHVLDLSGRECFQPDPFATEQPFAGDDLFRVSF
jgi:hypothetical protein